MTIKIYGVSKLYGKVGHIPVTNTVTIVDNLLTAQEIFYEWKGELEKNKECYYFKLHLYEHVVESSGILTDEIVYIRSVCKNK